MADREYGKADHQIQPMKAEEMGGAPDPAKLGRMMAEHDADAKGTEQAPDPSPFAPDAAATGGQMKQPAPAKSAESPEPETAPATTGKVAKK